MRNAIPLLATLTFISFSALLSAVTMVQPPNDKRAMARELLGQNNFQQALQLYRELLDQTPGTPQSGEDLQQAVQCLVNLGLLSEADTLVEGAVSRHAENFHVLLAAANAYSALEDGGFVIAGKFQRGAHRGGGQWASVEARDRVRSLQLLLQALQLAKAQGNVAAEQTAAVWFQISELIGAVRFGEAWKLQELTNLETLPDFELGNRWNYGFRGWGPQPRNGAPVDAEGNPIFHRLPDAWTTATSDGERWRFAMDQVSQFDPKRRSEIDLLWAAFLQSQFGTATADSSPPVVVVSQSPETATTGTAPPAASGAWAVRQLTDAETIARLANGVRRFSLPDEFNFLRILNAVAERNDASHAQALEALISERMSRHQYPQASTLLKKLLTVIPEDLRSSVQARIDQIEKNWISLLSAGTRPAGKGASFDIRFRNGQSVTFEASPVRVDQLLTDVRKYLSALPEEPDWRRMNIQDIGWMLITEDAGKYLEKPVASWNLSLTPAAEHADTVQTVATPLQKGGAYWVTAKMQDGNEARMVLWVADLAITRKRVEQGTLYFVADAVSGAPVAAVEMEFFGWHQDYSRPQGTRILTSRFADRTDENGFCIPQANASPHQWVAIARAKDGRFAFDGFSNLWNPEKIEPLAFSPIRIYAITDRPIYRPDHTVRYRIWHRNPRFDAAENSKAEQDCWVQIRDPKGELIFEQQSKTDRWAGVDGEWVIPPEATPGTYQIGIAEERVVPQVIRRNGQAVQVPGRERVLLGGGSFAIEEYRKPEYEVVIEAPDKPVRLGEKIQAKVTAKYFFGAPVTDARVHYKVERTKQDQRWFPVARWDWLYSPGYWWYTPSYEWYPGFRKWGCLPPMPPWAGWNPDPPEVVSERDADLNADGTLTIEIDSASALENHGDSDHSYSISAEVMDRSRRTIIGSGRVLVAREPFRVFTWTDQGHYQTDDTIELGFQARTPDGKPVVSQGKVRLFSVHYDGSDKPVEQEVQAWDAATDAAGSGSLKLRVPQSGQFRLSVTLSDAEGHEQEGATVLFVRGPDDRGTDYRFNDLELITDKREYAPGETARIQINTNYIDSTVLLFVRPVNGLCPQPQVLRLQGKSALFELPITADDQPNIFIEALTIADGKVHTAIRELVVPPEQRVTNVEVQSETQISRPGDEARVQVRLTDLQGQPVQGNVVVSVYDASLEAIAASTIPEIRRFFWDVRRSHMLTVESSLQRQSSPIIRDNELVMQPLYNQYATGAMGGGDALYRSEGQPRFNVVAGMAVADSAPMEMGAPAAKMMAGGMPGAPGGAPSAGEAPAAVRSAFADTAYWVASTTSDDKGLVSFSFRVPDNLTTWKIKVWTMADGTRVGSGEASLIARRNLLIRPQAPRFFTEQDQLVLSGIVHNYLASEKSVRVILENEDGHLQLLSSAEQQITLAPNGEARVDWRVHVKKSGQTKLRMKALTDEESDAVELSLPVQVHGLLKTESFSSVIRPEGQSASFTIDVPEQRLPEQSRLEIRYSPTLATALLDTLPWLIEYPWGCTEQTLNRFLPAVLVQRTLQTMGVNLAQIRQQRISLDAQQSYRGKFPAHWGSPPAVQTRDLRELPAGFGRGSSTLAKWIQEHIDADTAARLGLPKSFNPVFDDGQMKRLVRDGLQSLSEAQLSDGGWGWFSGYGERSSAHITAQVVHGLTIARQNDVPVLPDVLQRGVEWLQNYQAKELERLREGDKHRADPAWKGQADYKTSADHLDAFVASVLCEHSLSDAAMNEYLHRDRGNLTVYGMALTATVMHKMQDLPKRDLLLQNIEQFLEQDDTNQTAWLRLPETSWWYWYGSDTEAMAVYLKLLTAIRPENPVAPRLVKYLLNNRKSSSHWNSTRDTALVVEAMAEYVRATGENKPEMTVEVLIDGQVRRTVDITPENLFSFENSLILEGDDVTTGKHTVEVRRKGRGPLWISASLTTFAKTDFLTAAGLEVNISRRFYRLQPEDRMERVRGSRGQVVEQKVSGFKRIPIDSTTGLPSGTLVEVELVIDSKNDYEYLQIVDYKPSGFEPDDQRSGYVFEGLHAWRELRDNRVSFFLTNLARGQHSISYRMRAEAPGNVSALPATIEGMYSPELVGNSDEMRLTVEDSE